MKTFPLIHSIVRAGALLVLLMPVQVLRAQSVTEMMLNIPDSVMPYVIRHTITAEKIQTVFGIEFIKTVSSDDHLQLSADGKVAMEILRLPSETDSVFCVLRTVLMPERDTEVTIRDSRWNILRTLDFHDAELTLKPDTMSQKRYDELLKSFELRMVEARVSAKDELKLSLQVPLQYADEKKEIDTLFVQKSVKWNGKMFK